MVQFGGYLMQFHLASDWSQNNKHSRIFSGVHAFTGKTVMQSYDIDFSSLPIQFTEGKHV